MYEIINVFSSTDELKQENFNKVLAELIFKLENNTTTHLNLE